MQLLSFESNILYIKSSRCPKLDGYAIANFGVRVEREVVKIIHYGWSSGEMKWSSEWLSGLMG